jgi:hypothetical protein
MNRLKVFALMAIVLLTDFYLVDPSVRLPAVAMALLVGVHLARYGIPYLSLWGGGLLSELLGVSLAFISYMGLVDLARGRSLVEVGVQSISYALVIFLLPAFIERRESFATALWFRRFALITLLFAFLQVTGFHFALVDLVPDLGVIGGDPLREELVDEYGRATGATYNTIAFTLQMVMLILLTYSGYLLDRRLKRLPYGLLGLVGLLLGQTRAAIFGLLPAVVLSHLLFAKSRLRTTAKLVPLLLAGFALAWVVQQVAKDYFPYLVKEIGESDTHRLTTNLYMTIGVFRESPWFGISPEQAWDVYFRHADLSKLYQYTPEMKTPTHHNQLGFYFRYYGLIGIAFLVALYYQVFRIVRACQSEPMRIFLGGLFILDFMYSMTHNNKLLTSPLLWIFLSMACLPMDRANRALAAVSRGV